MAFVTLRSDKSNKAPMGIYSNALCFEKHVVFCDRISVRLKRFACHFHRRYLWVYNSSINECCFIKLNKSDADLLEHLYSFDTFVHFLVYIQRMNL